MRFEKKVKLQLDKRVSKSAVIVADGNQVAIGYKPDRIYNYNKHHWIIEIESSTSRKGFIGGYVKAQKHIAGELSAEGSLMFIINEKNKNTRLESIHKQLLIYHNWLEANGLLMQTTHLIYATSLYDNTLKSPHIFSPSFLRKNALTIGA